ncbi:MAG: SGNH/GDSL hydrolase family protein [Desulfobaccales bacterium]
MFFKSKTFRLVLLTVILPILTATVMAEFYLGMIEQQQRKSLADYGKIMGNKKGGMGPGGNLPENLNTYLSDGLGGQMRLITNSQGFRNDREFSPRPKPGVLRILSLGDSFTAGYRVGQKETFSSLLEEWINRHYGKCEVLVAQTEEPATALYYLEHFGVKFHPDVVLLGITLGNDIAQNYLSLDRNFVLPLAQGDVRIERNNSPPKAWSLEECKIPADYLQPRTPLEQMVAELGRWLRKRRLFCRLFQEDEPITSGWVWYPPRLFDPNNGLGMYANPPPPEVAEAYQKLNRILEAFQIYCERRGIILVVQLFPQRYQVSSRDWERAVAHYGLKASRFDFMGPNKKIQAFCRKHHIFLIDPTAALAADYARTGINLYLPRGDMHWNREGHRVFFESSQKSFGILAARGFSAVQTRDSGRVPIQKADLQ